MARDPAIADARPKDAAVPEKKAPSRTAHNGAVFDLREARTVSTLVAKIPWHTATDATTHYVLGADEVLRAFDLDSGKQRWEATLGFRVWTSAHDDGALWVHRELPTPKSPAGSELSAFDRDTGARRDFRFRESVVDVLPSGARTFVLLSTGDLLAIDAKSGTELSRAKLPFLASHAWLRGTLHPTTKRDGLCLFGTPASLEVACFDTTLSSTRRATIDPRKPTDPPGTSFYLEPRGAYTLYKTSAYGPGARRSVVLRSADGLEVARVDEEVAGVVEREDGGLEGLLVFEPELMLLEPSGAVRFRAGKMPAHFHAVASSFVRGETLVVAAHSAISTGTDVFALDRRTGKKLWTAEVEMPPIGHSKYRNDSTIFGFEDRVVLLVDESSVAGLQIFAQKDGKRLLSDTRTKW